MRVAGHGHLEISRRSAFKDNLSCSAVTFFLKPLKGVKQQEGSQRSSKGSESRVPLIRYSQNGDQNQLLKKWRLKENSRKEQSAFFTKTQAPLDCYGHLHVRHHRATS